MEEEMDYVALVKDAALLGLAVGVIVMGAYMLYHLGRFMFVLAPAITAAAASAPVVQSPSFGFKQA
jgi:hypothetical protein